MRKNLLKIVAVIFSLCLTSAALFAQTRTVSGKVCDSQGEPLIGASVFIEGTKTGTITDIDGKWSLSVPADAKLKAEFLGFEPQTQAVGSRSKVDFYLSEEKNLLDDVVVIAYGSAKKTDLTGSVSSVKMDDLKDSPAISIDNALQGRIAGADFMSTDGAPGSTTTIRIRGTRSITASNEPLFVVDGVMDAIHDLNDISPEDIASVTVLKDASSTAIYGSRGANGVIIVTTKSGRSSSGKPNISFRADVGVAALPKSLDIMSASEFAQYRNDYAYLGKDAMHSGVGPQTPLSGSVYKDPLSLGKGTDWIDEITRTAVSQNYALSLTGGEAKSSYFVSLGYNDTQGIIQASGQQRATGRVKISRDFFKWLKLTYSGSYTWRYVDENKASIGGTSWWNAAQYLSPMIAPDAYENPLYNLGQRINTPRSMIDLVTNYTNRHTLNNSATVDITPIKDLKISSIFSYYLYKRGTYRYTPGSLPAKTEGEGGQATRAEYGEWSMNNETTIRYNFKSGGHSFVPMLGFSAYRYIAENFTLSGNGYMDDAVKWNNMNAVLDKETYSAGTSRSMKNKMSAFVRADYNWSSRYYITATGRYDGASNFAENSKWAFFPSGAFRWNISNEPFMKNVSWIDDFSIRLSAGMTGNDSISAYQSLAALSSTTGGYLFDGSQPVAFYRSRLAQPELTWEKTASYNIGLDLAMFKNRVAITADAYASRTTDLLLSVQVANQTGYSSTLRNLGIVSNKGVELTIDTRNIMKKYFQWTTTLTFSHNKQKVEDIGSKDFVPTLNSPGNNGYMMYGYVKGYPLNSLWGFKYGGVWNGDEERARNEATRAYVGINYKNEDGTPKYSDINHDGVLNQEDLVYQGSADPILYGGIQNTFTWKGLRLSVYFAYSLGGKIYNYGEFYMSGGMYTNQYRYMLNGWHPERNPQSNIPRAGYTDTALPSDFLIHDASYLRLKNLSLGYTLDLSKTKSHLRDITFTLVGDNVFLLKNYNGFDPDVSSNGTSSTLRRVDLGAYPKARTVTFSVQIRY